MRSMGAFLSFPAQGVPYHAQHSVSQNSTECSNVCDRPSRDWYWHHVEEALPFIYFPHENAPVMPHLLCQLHSLHITHCHTPSSQDLADQKQEMQEKASDKLKDEILEQRRKVVKPGLTLGCVLTPEA